MPPAMRLYNPSYQVVGLILSSPLEYGWLCDLLFPVKCGGRGTIRFLLLDFKSFGASIFIFLKYFLLEGCLRSPGSGKSQVNSTKSPVKKIGST